MIELTGTQYRKTTYTKYIFTKTSIYIIYKRERENRKSKQQKERERTPQIGQTT